LLMTAGVLRHKAAPQGASIVARLVQ
jgi:hypothetical protein